MFIEKNMDFKQKETKDIGGGVVEIDFKILERKTEELKKLEETLKRKKENINRPEETLRRKKEDVNRLEEKIKELKADIKMRKIMIRKRLGEK